MSNFDVLFEALKEELDALKVKFLSNFLPAKPEDSPVDFEYEVKSFSLLSHAAFEEYIEAVSENMMTKIENDFMMNKFTLSTICFVSAYGIKLVLPDDDNTTDGTCFNHIRDAIEKAKKLHSSALKDNHGFSSKYMRKLLIPVGINMPQGPEMASLKKLADARGTFAHNMAKLANYGEYKRAHRVLTPEEAAQAAEDCCHICDTVRQRAKAV